MHLIMFYVVSTIHLPLLKSVNGRSNVLNPGATPPLGLQEMPMASQDISVKFIIYLNEHVVYIFIATCIGNDSCVFAGSPFCPCCKIWARFTNS